MLDTCSFMLPPIIDAEAKENVRGMKDTVSELMFDTEFEGMIRSGSFHLRNVG